jgi:hypothetical protein
MRKKRASIPYCHMPKNGHLPIVHPLQNTQKVELWMHALQNPAIRPACDHFLLL